MVLSAPEKDRAGKEGREGWRWGWGGVPKRHKQDGQEEVLQG